MMPDAAAASNESSAIKEIPTQIRKL